MLYTFFFCINHELDIQDLKCAIFKIEQLVLQ